MSGEGVGAAIGAGRGHRVHRDPAQGPLREGDVEEAGSGDVDLRDGGLRGQLGGDDVGHLARRAARGLGQPECDVGRIVAVLAILGAVDDDLVRDVDGEHASADGPAHGGADEGLQLLGCHRTSVLTPVLRTPGPPGTGGPAGVPT